MSRSYKKFGARHKARKRGVDMLFEAEARGVDPVALAAERVEMSASDESIAPVNEFTSEMLAGVAENLDRIDAVIADHLQDWSLERLPAVDRAILRIAVWELFHTDVPPVVAVDEAVELAKLLSTDDSPSFINGVLGRIVTVAPQVRAAAAATAAVASAVNAPAVNDPASDDPAVDDPAVEVPADSESDSDHAIDHSGTEN